MYWKTSTAPCSKVYRGYSLPCLTSFWPQRAWQVDKSTVPSAKGLTRAHSLANDTFVSVAISCYSMCEVTDLFWPRSARGHIHCTMCQGYTSQPTLWKTWDRCNLSWSPSVELTDFILSSWGWQADRVDDYRWGNLHRALLTRKFLLTRWNATHFWQWKSRQIHRAETVCLLSAANHTVPVKYLAIWKSEWACFTSLPAKVSQCIEGWSSVV